MSNPVNNPLRYFNSSPEVIGLVVMMYVRYPLSLRNVEDLLAERRIEISHETARFWWNRFGPMFAAEIRKRRAAHVRGFIQWRWVRRICRSLLCPPLMQASIEGRLLRGFGVKRLMDLPLIWADQWRALRLKAPSRS